MNSQKQTQPLKFDVKELSHQLTQLNQQNSMNVNTFNNQNCQTNQMNEFATETNKLVQITIDVTTGYYGNQIQELSGKQFKEVLFDTEFCDWSIRTSTINKHLFERNHFVISIETQSRKKMGC